MDDAGWTTEAAWHTGADGIDIDRASVARMYDYYLGGSHNFAADRRAADALIARTPNVLGAVKANRAFLRRAVHRVVERGVTQFLDIGSGLPAVGNVHEVAQARVPTARVCYVDNDPVAVAHSQDILAGTRHTAALQADLRQPGAILADRRVRNLLDFDRPVALMLVAVLHFIADEAQPAELVATLCKPLAPGSVLVISHGSREVDEAYVQAGVQVYQTTSSALRLRTRSEVTAFFDGLTLEPPGVVYAPQWHPESPDDVGEHPEDTGMFCGLAVKE